MLFPLPHYLTADEASAKATISSIASVKTGLFLDKILDHSLLQQILDGRFLSHFYVSTVSLPPLGEFLRIAHLPSTGSLPLLGEFLPSFFRQIVTL